MRRWLDNVQGSRVIDATAQGVTPGFVDMNTHSEYPLLYDGNAQTRFDMADSNATDRSKLGSAVYVNRAAERSARPAGSCKGLSAEEQEARCLRWRDQRADKLARVIDVGVGHVRAREAVPGSQGAVGIDRASLKFTRPGVAIVDAFAIDHLSESCEDDALVPGFDSRTRVKRPRSDCTAKGTRVIDVIRARILIVRSRGIIWVSVNEVEFAAKGKH